MTANMECGMIVTLNGQALDVTLERERTLGEFLSAIEEWLEKSNYSLSGFSVDGQPIPPEALEEACARDLIEVEKVDLRAASWKDLLLDAVAIGGRAIEEAASERENARREGRIAECGAIRDRFAGGPAASFLGGRMPDLEKLIETALGAEGLDPESALKAAAAAVEERDREIRNPRKELGLTRENIAPLALRLEELPLHLQTGKDALAANTLKDFSFFCEKILRLVPLLSGDGILLENMRIGEIEFKSFIEELTAAMKELTAAFEKGDAVLVGDLAEYELAPRVRALDEAIERLAAV